nr:hypothetical protein [uncultured Oscillibacter sp.]
MKKSLILLLSLVTAALLAAGCGAAKDVPAAPPAAEPEAAQAPEAPRAAVADASQMAPVEDVVDPGLVPVRADALRDGVYDIAVDSSSSMFTVTSCELTVAEGKMTALMHTGGTGYLYIYPGAGEEAAQAAESAWIPYAEDAGGHTFTFPVEALDMGLDCAAFSKKKEMWYDRTLVFRADSLPLEAFRDGVFATAESLGLADGGYTVSVRLEGGSGRAAVESPAALRVEGGRAYAAIVWGSSSYDYMRIDAERFLPLNTEGNSAFEIPVAAFDRALTVYADTTAMSTPHEIEYTLYFDSASIEAAP